jgi:hypothetical protein
MGEQSSSATSQDVVHPIDGLGDVDLTPTHRVVRISNHPHADRVFFNALGRSLQFESPDPETGEPRGAQDVPAAVAEAITSDDGLAPHFRCDEIPTKAIPAAAGRRDRARVRAEDPSDQPVA